MYYVDGGMEDWAYAASWENQVNNHLPINDCISKAYTLFETTAKDYELFSVRTFLYLIETASIKIPPESQLGNDVSNIYDANPSNDGHIPRNMRMALSLIDMAEPYIQ